MECNSEWKIFQNGGSRAVIARCVQQREHNLLYIHSFIKWLNNSERPYQAKALKDTHNPIYNIDIIIFIFIFLK